MTTKLCEQPLNSIGCLSQVPPEELHASVKDVQKAHRQMRQWRKRRPPGSRLIHISKFASLSMHQGESQIDAARCQAGIVPARNTVNRRRFSPWRRTLKTT